ncbi:uncharacterized protein LOC144706068 [Wolffia australiana]
MERPLCSSLFFLFLCNFLCAIAITEKEILLQIKAEWGSPQSLISWSDLPSSSSSSSSHCSWNGLTCDSAGSVVSIVLIDQGIVGGVPEVLCELKNLTVLNLYNNSIGGEFPIGLKACENLRELNLSQNLFVGGIPDDVGRISSLRILDLSYNNFSGDVPAALAKISKLRVLNLVSNVFDGSFPRQIGDLAELEYLCLAYNPFSPTAIPSEFGRMKNLRYLWISDSSLIGDIPETIGDLSKLEHLDLSSNSLSGEIPAKILQLKKLKNLYLYGNRLTGEIKTFGATNLIQLDLSMNDLTGPIPPDLGNLINLEALVLYNNRFSGQIPFEIAKIPNLQDIRIFNNLFTGVIPPELGKNSTLVYLEIFNNSLHGPLPEHLCFNNALVSIVAYDNKLNGSLPSTLARCDALASLLLHNNELSGEIPAGIWSSAKLSHLLLRRNRFSGELPGRLPPSLARLEVEDNEFSGKVPSSSPGLKVFRGGNNRFSGELPSDLSAMAELQELLLGGNRISGEIPAGIGVLAFLTKLDLSSNSLTGTIPEEIAGLPSLTMLDVSENDLSGEIPAAIMEMKLSFLNLSSNSFSGKKRNPPWLLDLAILLAFLLFFLFLAALALRKKKAEKKVRGGWEFTKFQAMEISEGEIVGGLKAENLIARGGSGEVFLVRGGGGAAAAVKKLRHELTAEAAAEVGVLAGVRHANIVKLISAAAAAPPLGRLLVYEYAPNGSLQSWLRTDRRPTLDWPKRLVIAVDVARALSYLHHDCVPSVIHRDVKPGNILLDGAFRAKLGDFGLALTGPGCPPGLAGSLGYVAPSPGLPSVKDDVYAFGVVLLEMVTGRAAVDGVVEWAWGRFRAGGEAEVDADAIGGSRHEKEMTAVVRLALFCTAEVAAERPTMKLVAQVLSRLAEDCGRSQSSSWDDEDDQSGSVGCKV